MSYNTAVTDVLTNHVTIRQFTDQDVSQEMVQLLLDAGRRAPTSSNMQTYSIVVVRNQAVKAEIAELAGGQRHIAVCPVFFAFCADLSKIEASCNMHELPFNSNLESTLVSTVDAALVGMNVMSAAESMGLGAVMIGAMRNDPKRAAKLLGLPSGCYVVYGMCVGWPDEAKRPPQKPRLPERLMVHYETYNLDGRQADLAAHDVELGAHYAQIGRPSRHEAAWSGVVANYVNPPRRPNLKAELEALGMRFD